MASAATNRANPVFAAGARGAVHPNRPWMIATAGGGLALSAAVAFAAATGWNSEHPWVAVGPRVAVIWSFLAAGGWALTRRPGDRFGALLVALAFGYGIVMLHGSSNDAIYSLGRFALPFAEVGLAYAILAFPSGRLTLRRDRRLIAALTACVCVLWPIAVLTDDRFRIGGSQAACGDTCPSNVLAVWDYPGLARASNNLLYLAFAAAMAALVLSLVRRFIGSSPVVRRALEIVLIVAGVRAATVAVYGIAKVAAPDSTVAYAVGWLPVAAGIAIPLACLFAAVRARLFATSVLASLIAELNRAPGPAAFRNVLSRAIGDPSLELVRRNADSTLSDVDGNPVNEPGRGSGRAISDAAGSGGGLALIHDEALGQDEQFLFAVCAAAALEDSQYRQRERVRTLLHDLRTSKARISAARDEERRRIERDLHDGAQQHLVAVRVQIGVVQSIAVKDPAAAQLLINQAADELDAAISQLRDLAHGVYRPLLESDGLAEALTAAAVTAVLPTTVEHRSVGRLSAEIETAVYFTCLEAMQNADKHAGSEAHVRVSLERAQSQLRFSVSDDGRGFDPASPSTGVGFTNMRDRVESLGGSLSIESGPGRGATVAGWLPMS
ncbi:MAG: hypothetical protein QOF68_2850 [Gaiellales bacterium]|nr:hypothetical protein [Gaiellales bacterium]